ncbi:outer membrane protein [Helicobacter bizzozeronii]|uniref:OMP756 n=1 Tax=Helicobacter bizzozeronii TaxID=56877 RepID=A0A1M4NGY0_HELBI|nr:outer membrane protein [Helicobacter bizzozeronii]SFZ71540.1 OMP756 [Helicobacter bizzozeronii]
MRKFLLGVPLVLGVASSGLMAEKGGGFIGINYQVGQGRMNTGLYTNNNYSPGMWHLNKQGVAVGNQNWQGTNISWHGKYANGAMNGFGFLAGQSFFFKPLNAKTAWLGVRYYGFFDYGYAHLGRQLSLPTTVGGSIYNGSVDLSMIAYGVGTDLMGNFFDREDASVGVYGGFAIGGNAWQVNKATLHAWEDALMASNTGSVGKPSHGNFNVWLNFGFRANIHKHNGIELGVKIPMLVNKFLKTAGGQYYSLKRDYSVYLGYLYTF